MEVIIIKTVNERIKEIRKKAKMNQKDFGHTIGLTQSAVSWIEIPGNTVTEQNIMQISSIYNVSPEWLKTGSGEVYTLQNKEVLEKAFDKFELTAEQRRLMSIFLEMPPKKRQKVAVAFLTLYDVEIPAELADYDFDEEKENHAKKAQAATPESSRSENGSVKMLNKKDA